jgi:small subunit ribosomal protein S16
MGRKKIPYYRVIAIDSRRSRDGLELEKVGVYNPLPEEPVFNVDEERLFYWLEQGAEISDTIRNLMKQHGLALKWHLKSQGKSDEEIEKEFQKWQLLRESKESAKAEQQQKAEEEAKKKAAEEKAAAEAAEAAEAEEEAPAEEAEAPEEEEVKAEETDAEEDAQPESTEEAEESDEAESASDEEDASEESAEDDAEDEEDKE